MRIRFASWNLNSRRATARHFEILRNARLDIVALQEVPAALHEAIAAEGIFAWGASSLSLRRPRRTRVDRDDWDALCSVRGACTSSRSHWSRDLRFRSVLS